MRLRGVEVSCHALQKKTAHSVRPPSQHPNGRAAQRQEVADVQITQAVFTSVQQGIQLSERQVPGSQAPGHTVSRGPQDLGTQLRSKSASCSRTFSVSAWPPRRKAKRGKDRCKEVPCARGSGWPADGGSHRKLGGLSITSFCLRWDERNLCQSSHPWIGRHLIS